jgi:putative membrane protein
MLGMGSAALASDLDKADVRFMNKAAQSGQLEIQASTLAEKSASSPDVKSFAATMVTDHTQAGEALKALAASKGVTLPAGLTAAQQSQLAGLGKLQGAQFDKTYSREIGVAAHKEAVSLFKKASRNAKDQDVKAFAAKTLPTLQGHLKMAKAMRQTVKKAQ